MLLSNSPPPLLLLPLFPLFFVGMWMLVTFIISNFGWRAFAQQYRCDVRPEGTVYRSPRAMFGSLFASYNNVVRVIFTESGVYFYPLFLFRAFHPPFLLPWSSVKQVEKRERWYGNSYQMEVVDPAGKISLMLPTKVEGELFSFYRGRKL